VLCSVLSLGGHGFGSVEECIIGEALSFGCTGITAAVTANNLGVSSHCIHQ